MWHPHDLECQEWVDPFRILQSCVYIYQSTDSKGVYHQEGWLQKLESSLSANTSAENWKTKMHMIRRDFVERVCFFYIDKCDKMRSQSEGANN